MNEADGSPMVCGPHDESSRLAALRNLGILDTPPSEYFDRVTRLAADILKVPIVLMSLVEESRQWFKSRFGLDESETCREMSFCAHAVINRQPLLVPDATKDRRFADNPWVTGTPFIRAYLGIPIYTDKGFAIGTLCAIDVRPRDFDESEVRRLHDCAKVLEEALQARELAKNTEGLRQLATEREQLFRDTFQHAAVGITHTSLSGRLLRVNKKAADMMQYSAAELCKISFLDITHADDIAKNAALFQKMMAGHLDEYRMEKRFRCKDGSYLWADVSASLVRSATGEPDYVIAVIEDIAERKQTELDLVRVRDSLRMQLAEQTAKLKESNDALQMQIKKVLESDREVRQVAHRFRAITDNMPALIAYWNRDLVCEFANAMHKEWYGIEPQKVVGMSMAHLMGEARFEKLKPHVQVTLEGHPQRFEMSADKADGSQRFGEVRYIPDFLSAGVVAGFYVLVTDVTHSRVTQKALEKANAKLTADSVTDYLTGLSNRRVFSERSEDALMRFQNQREPYGLILLDLDNFKQINDIYGHTIGDDVLRAVGKLLNGQLRSHRDIAARLGGEEFAILCFGDLDESLLRVVAERVRTQLKQETVNAGSRHFNFTASFGLALSSTTDTDWKNIYARADAALYEAKAAGKDRIAFGKVQNFAATGKFRALRTIKA